MNLDIIDKIKPKPNIVPPAIPKDLSDRIIQLHGHPIAWWISQFLKYLLRAQPELESVFKKAEKSLGFTHPIVGMHVRRTDKVISEASFHRYPDKSSPDKSHLQQKPPSRKDIIFFLFLFVITIQYATSLLCTALHFVCYTHATFQLLFSSIIF